MDAVSRLQGATQLRRQDALPDYSTDDGNFMLRKESPLGPSRGSTVITSPFVQFAAQEDERSSGFYAGRHAIAYRDMELAIGT